MPKGQQFKYSDVAESFISNRIIEEDRAASAEFFKLENMLSALKSSPSDFFTFRTRHADGSLHWNRTLIFHSDASQSCLVMSRRDITRLYDEEQQQKQVLQKAVAAANEANQAKSDFLSRISHDMRTPLNAVIGLTGLAKEEKNPPKTAEYLDNIEDSGKLLLELINDILDLSRIESGETELVLEPYSLAEFKRNIDSVIRPLMDKKNIQFICQLNADVDNICVDKMRFCQIFLNLLTNSAKFTQSGGRVEFISEHIPDDELGRYGLRFYVRDTGRGMSESFLSRLFLPFTQENSSPELQGSGLGLAIVKRLVDSFGGTISVKSELGKGTEFVIDLHAHHESNIPGTAKSANEDFSHLFGKHILLVEDNMINTLVAKALLESKGCEVDTALNGLESISKFETSENGFYDAILMDVRMPVMDGIEATQRISRLKRQEAKTIPIIAMTANAFSEDHEQTMQAGMNAHLSKPIDPSQLFNTILSLIK